MEREALSLLRPAERMYVLRLLQSRRNPDRVVGLVKSRRKSVARAALVYVGLAGGLAYADALHEALRGPDDEAALIAEFGLWSAWMHGGSPDGNEQLCRAVEEIRGERFPAAEQRLRRLCATDPQFAEARHQLGITLFFLERVEAAAGALAQTVLLNPRHFGAHAALGHVAAHRGDIPAALEHYRRARQLHPRMEGLPENVGQLRMLCEHRRATG